MDIFLLRALANNVKVKEASAGKAGDLKGVIKSIALATISGGGSGGRGNFMAPDVNFDEVYRAYKTDAYVRQAIDKYAELMFKAGWKLQGQNDAAIAYLESRFKFMSYATGNPMDQLFIEIAEDLVKYSNALIVKARNKKNITIPSIKATGIDKSGAPVGGYFRLNPRTIQVKADEYGNVSAWQQEGESGKTVTFKIEDVIHIYYKREAGEIFAIPYVAPALEDVRLLRQLEDNIAVLVYRYAVPIYHWIIGLAQPGYEASPEEILEAKGKINEMPTDGAIITNERTTIKAIGADGLALQAEPYMRYFEQRVFTGLGVSETQMGRGGTANKNTADSLDQGMVDRVKAFQKVMSLGITNGILVELLLEGGFDPLNNPDDLIEFVFNEVNVDTQIKVENHKLNMFQSNAITYDEMRSELGRDIEVDESRLFHNMFGNASVNEQIANTDQPENQNGKKLSPSIKPKSESKKMTESTQKTKSLEEQVYYQFMNDIDKADIIDAKLMASAASDSICRQMLSDISFIESAKKDVKIEKSLEHDITLDSDKVLSIIEGELRNDIYNMLVEVASKSAAKDKNAVFKTNEYRLRFIKQYWTAKMYQVAKLLCYKSIGVTQVEILGAESDNDKVCSPRHTVLPVAMFTTKNVPPFHPGCQCYIKPKEQ